MKKCIFTLLMLCAFATSQAQTDNAPATNTGKNEIKLNSFFLLLGVFEPSYERNLSENGSVGISMFIPYDNDVDWNINYYVSPYYRAFFGKKYAAGFFLEGFGMLNSTINTHVLDYYNGIVRDENNTNFAVGFGLGSKWYTRGGFVFEINGGFGRNLFNADAANNDNLFVGKFGFNLGYRF